jgi:DNA-directed RNA polymerase subunit omega
MYDPAIDELVKKTGSLYKLVLLAARRSVELSEGATKLVDAPHDAKSALVALQEILEGRVSFKIKEEK